MSQQQKPVISTSFSYETLEETLDIKPKGVPLHIGIPKETAFQENRIALTPDAVGVLVSNGHEVVIEHNAGEAAHYRDRDYSEAGARIMYDKSEVLKAPILVKSAPVIEEDLPLLHLNQIIISPIHLSAMKAELLQKMMDKRITGISFENLKDDSGTYPIVRSMSEIAGSAVMLVAGQYLSSANHGKGVLLGGISGIPPTKVIILGAGIVGEFAEGTPFEERLKFNAPSQAPLSYIRSVYETNVFGVIAVTQAMLPLLREAPAGRIVNVGSSLGSLTLNANPESQFRNIFGSAYSPSKAALSATTLAFAIELEKTNIKVNVVCPGYVATDLNDHRGYRTVEQGAKQAVKMALIGPDGPTGTFTDEDGTVPW